MSESNTRSSCPYLGLKDDRGIYCLFPEQLHRCYRSSAARAIPWDLQELFCLREGYVDCPAYQGRALAEPKRTRRLGYTALAVGAFLVPLALLAQAIGALGGTSPPPSAPLAATEAVTAPGSETSAAPGVSGAARLVAEPPVAPAITPVPASLPAIQTGTTPTGSQPGAPGQDPSSSPTPALPARDDPPRTHVVSAGETLASIARRYGTTVDAIVRTNRLVDKNLIVTGQRLLIP